jgi:hypothetical protein
MNRTTIMSHGGVHDAAGVVGTHLRGTIPAPAVLDAIPPAIGTVGNVPETALAGQGPTTRQPTEKQATVRRWFDDEGNPDFPPRDGPSTQRPAPKVVTADKVEEPPASARGGAASASVPPPPDPAPPARDEVSAAEPVAQVPAPDLGLSKRKLGRATVEQLREWCQQAGIRPEEYVDSDEEVNGVLMRRLLSEKFSIEM